MEVRCQCGGVSFNTGTDKPLALYICHCAECRRQASANYGTSAIFSRFPLPDVDLLSCYTRPTASGHTLYCYFCRDCGTVLIHTSPGKNVVSVKGRCIKGLDWGKAIHIWTKSAMVPIPEGSETHSEESGSTNYSHTEAMLDQPIGQPGEIRESGGVGPDKPLAGVCELSGY